MAWAKRICASTTVVVTLLGWGCSGRNPPKEQIQSPVIAFVAASTKDAIEEIAELFSNAKGVKVRINAEDSSKLATQIANDAPAHVFISANAQWAQFIMNQGYGQENKVLLGNKLVIVAPTAMASKIKEPGDLLRGEITKVALAGPNVPAGIYARQALKKLGLWDELEKSKRVVSGENVRVALTYVERGEADAGLVYATDAMISKQVAVAYQFDPATHDPIRYAAVLLKAGAALPAAKDFFEFLASDKAAGVFQRHGFAIPAVK